MLVPCFNYLNCLEFLYFITAVLFRIQVFWDVTLYHSNFVSRSFSRNSALETTGNTNSATRRHIAEELNSLHYTAHYNHILLQSHTLPFIINDETGFKTLSLFYMFLHGTKIVHVLFIKRKLHNIHSSC